MRPCRRSRALGLGLSVLLGAGSVAFGAPAAQADAVRSGQWYLQSLGVAKAWQVSKGSGVRIGIVDSGVDGSAPDLRGMVVGGKDFSGGGSVKGGPVGVNSHGTEVASLAAARGRAGGAGIIGTAPKASVLSAAITFDSNGPSGSRAPQAIRWVVDHGAKVVNLSFDTESDLTALRAAVAYAQSKDVVVVAATGNVGSGSFSLPAPASFPGVVAVTGIDKDLRRDPGATVGPGTALAAPYSTTATTPFSTKPYTGLPVASLDGRYDVAVGTSMAAPIVSGIVALIRSKYPDENAATVITRLLKSATPAGGSVPNNTYGYGIVNAAKALSISVAKTTTNPLGSSAPAGGSGSSSAPSPSNSGTASDPGVPSRSSSTSTSASSSSGSSSGPGTAIIAAIVIVVVVLIALVAWVVSRTRRRPPPGYGPSY